jgi:hypothetical protein
MLRRDVTLSSRRVNPLFSRSSYGKSRSGFDPAQLRACEFDAGMSARLVNAQRGAVMEHVKASLTVKSAVVAIAGVMMIAGAIVAFSSVQADARPAYVTKAKPCGSCHPPNKPPKK